MWQGSELLALWQSGAGVSQLLRIAHHIPGRIRLKLKADGLSDLSLGAALLQQLEWGLGVLGQIPGIRSVRLNGLARCCVLEYDPALIPQAAWEDLLADRDTMAANLLKIHLYNGYQEAVHAKL